MINEFANKRLNKNGTLKTMQQSLNMFQLLPDMLDDPPDWCDACKLMNSCSCSFMNLVNVSVQSRLASGA